MLISEMIELLEATKYDPMFDIITGNKLQYIPDNVKEDFKKAIDVQIDWARKFLKKEDRIIWYLRIAKIYYLEILLGRFPTDLNIEKISNEDDKLRIKKEKDSIIKERNKNSNKAGGYDSVRSLDTIKNNLTHYLGQDHITSIQNYRFNNEHPNELWEKFDEFEEEWKSKIGRDSVKIQDGDKLILPFDNGTKGWWLLDRGACREEGDAMGHCGNVPSIQSGDRILSFRTQIEKQYWKPHLTFILHGDGTLGEMKGRNNDKPNEKYHPYIIELLKQKDLVKGIKGGGYRPENNFSLNDLDESDRDELLELNPNLMNVFQRYRKDGFSKDILEEIKEKNYESQLPSVESIEHPTVVLEEWSNLEEFARSVDIDPLNKLMEKIDTEDDLVNNRLDDDEIQNLADELSVDSNEYYDILERMPTQVLQKIANDLNLTVNVSEYKGIDAISENIDKSKYGDIIRRAIVKVQDFSGTLIKEDSEVVDFIKLIINDVILRTTRTYYANLVYDEDNIFETDIKFEINFDQFVDILEESFNTSDNIDDDEAFNIAYDAINNQQWLYPDSYEVTEALKELKRKNKLSSFSDFDDEQITLYNDFMQKIDKTNVDLSSMKPVEIAREAIRMINFNESIEIKRLKVLAGNKK
jgi:hypothetical protein